MLSKTETLQCKTIRKANMLIDEYIAKLLSFLVCKHYSIITFIEVPFFLYQAIEVIVYCAVSSLCNFERI